jgi:hypothetical protein
MKIRKMMKTKGGSYGELKRRTTKRESKQIEEKTHLDTPVCHSPCGGGGGGGGTKEKKNMVCYSVFFAADLSNLSMQISRISVCKMRRRDRSRWNLHRESDSIVNQIPSRILSTEGQKRVVGE